MAYSTMRQLFKNLKLQSTGKADVKVPEDKQNPYITGCVFMPTGLVVLCDAHNHRVKVLNASQFTVKESMHLQTRPWDITVVDEDNVIVTLPDKEELQYLRVSPQLEKGRVIKLDKRCWGVELSHNKLYVTCHSGFGEGEVRVLDMDGNVIRSLGVGLDETYMFKCPFHLTVSALSGKIFVSDSYKPSVTCFLPDGKVQYEYRDPEISWDRGVCVDSEGYIMLCGQASDKVQIVNPGGKKHSTLLSSKDGIESPTVVTINNREDTLIVGYDKLFLYRIK